MAKDADIPLVDLAPFFRSTNKDNLEQQRQVIQQVAEACREWGFFHVVNHGLDPELLALTAKNSQGFFQQPKCDKLKHSKEFHGYNNLQGREVFEVSDSVNPNSEFNVWPDVPPTFRPVTENLMGELHKIANLVEEIVLESLGLSREELYKGAGDVLVLNYYSASNPGKDGLGLREHKDGDILTLVSQLNDTDGLQVLKGGQWLTIKPLENALIVNIGDVVQVWSNKVYQSVMHRVKESLLDRYSFAYFHQAGDDTVVKPLPRFTVDLNNLSLYQPFLLKDYTELRRKKKISLEYYAVVA